MPGRLSALLLACAASFPAWAAVVTPVSQGIRHDALFGLCLEGENGIAVGDAGVVMRSGDGGDSWQRQAGFTQAALLDVNCGPGAQFIVGQEGLVYRREGDGFRQLDSGSDQRLLAVTSNEDGLVFAVGGFGTVLRSTDNGESWEALSFDWEAILNDFLEPHIYAVDIADDGAITIAGEFALVMRSTDGGDNWEVANMGEASIFGMHLLNGRGFAVGQDGSVLLTEDGGASWAPVSVPSGANLLDVWTGGDGRVVISGIRELLLSDDAGGSWRAVREGDFGIGWYQRIAVAPGDTGGAVLLAGHQGRIVKLQAKDN